MTAPGGGDIIPIGVRLDSAEAQDAARRFYAELDAIGSSALASADKLARLQEAMRRSMAGGTGVDSWTRGLRTLEKSGLGGTPGTDPFLIGMARWREASKKTAESVKQDATGINAILQGVGGGFLKQIGPLAIFETLRRTMTQMFTAAAQGEQVELRLAAALKATGAAGGESARQVGLYAEELARRFKIDDDIAKAAAGSLAMFRNISGPTYREALKLSGDLAAAWNMDMVSAARTLGAALSDPIQGFMMLNRTSRAFTDAEEKAIIKLAETGRTAEAVKAIMDRLTASFGGQGEAAAGGLAGAARGATQAFTEFLEALGRTEAIGGTVKRELNWISSIIDHMAESMRPVEERSSERLRGEIKRLEETMTRSGRGGFKLSEADMKALRDEVELRKLLLGMRGEKGGAAGGATGHGIPTKQAPTEDINKLSASQEAFLKSLQRQADAAGKTGVELTRLQAIELGFIPGTEAFRRAISLSAQALQKEFVAGLKISAEEAGLTAIEIAKLHAAKVGLKEGTKGYTDVVEAATKIEGAQVDAAIKSIRNEIAMRQGVTITTEMQKRGYDKLLQAHQDMLRPLVEEEMTLAALDEEMKRNIETTNKADAATRELWTQRNDAAAYLNALTQGTTEQADAQVKVNKLIEENPQLETEREVLTLLARENAQLDRKIARQRAFNAEMEKLTTAEGQAQMLENAFESMLNTIAEGENVVKAFFKTLLDEFVRTVNKILAMEIANAIFGSILNIGIGLAGGRGSAVAPTGPPGTDWGGSANAVTLRQAPQMIRSLRAEQPMTMRAAGILGGGAPNVTVHNNFNAIDATGMDAVIDRSHAAVTRAVIKGIQRSSNASRAIRGR